MQTELARAELKRITDSIYQEHNEHEFSFELCALIDELFALVRQALDALDAVKAIGQLNADGIDVIEMENLK